MVIRSFDILCCQITIGDENPKNPIVIDNPIVITEVKGIEIQESYKQLIGTAKLTFPKGSVFKSTIIGNLTLEGKDAMLITTERMQDGVLVEKRTSQKVIDDNSFKIGQRINIKLGYNYVLKSMFDGYITAYNSDSMIEIQCENMAYKLKLEQSPKFETPPKGVTVNDICEGKYHLLKGTGFKLHSDTRKMNISLGKMKITDNFTVADILSEWSKHGIYCFLKYDTNSSDSMPAIAICRPYSYSSKKVSDPFGGTTISTAPYQIKFNEVVASNGLKVLKTDPKFLAVIAKAVDIHEKMFEVTVKLNPEYDSKDKNSKEFQIVNATQINKKTHKITGNTTAKGAKTKTKVDLSTYTVVPYQSTQIGITEDKLVEEAINYFKSYNLNGITGDLTLFGDFGMSCAVQAELIDERNPSKNGTYLVEEVVTKFGTEGYRQTIKIPYKIKGVKTYGNNR